MWTAVIIRILRRKFVLGVILALSSIYCIFNFWQDSYADLDTEKNGDSGSPRMLFNWHGGIEDSNGTSVQVTTCRNSVQGRDLIVDEKGFICARSDVLGTGCCNTEADFTKRYACDTCQPSGCCSVYEYCISCCLDPDKKEVLQGVLGKSADNVLFASVTDHFELCLAKCRTSSKSVRHENSYRDPSAKHCYGEIPLSEAVPS